MTDIQILQDLNLHIKQWILDTNFLYEIWLPIIYEDIVLDTYEVSNFGRIRNIKTMKIKSQCRNNDGRYIVSYYTQFKNMKNYYTSRIVATMFVAGKTEERNEVNHKDGIKSHNFDWNLEWVTPKENIAHAINNGLLKPHHSNSSVTDDQVHKICQFIKEYNGNMSKTYKRCIEENISVSYHVIRCIRDKRYWNHISINYFDEIYSKSSITDNEAHLICQLLLKHNMSIIKVQRELQKFSYSTIKNIKDKSTWRKISEKYF